jgi:hypothetical protein
MADTTMKNQRRDAAGAQRGGPRVEGSHPRLEDRDDGTAGKWSRSAPHDNPAKESESLASMFDRPLKQPPPTMVRRPGGVFGQMS